MRETHSVRWLGIALLFSATHCNAPTTTSNPDVDGSTTDAGMDANAHDGGATDARTGVDAATSTDASAADAFAADAAAADAFVAADAFAATDAFVMPDMGVDAPVCTANMPCSSPSCTGSTLTTAGTCNSTGSACMPGTTAACANGVRCEDTTSCLPHCVSSVDCATSTDFCASGVCMQPRSPGGVCTGNEQCSTGVCGGSHCCASFGACPAIVPQCGATDCDATGACVYPGNTVAPTGLQTPGDCQRVVCNGSGNDFSIDDFNDVPGPSGSACRIQPSCCGPSPLTPCYANAAAGTSCTSSGDSNARICGDPSNANVAGTCVECNTTVDCLAINPAGVLSCNTTTGRCQ
jgi:hypothetical protein